MSSEKPETETDYNELTGQKSSKSKDTSSGKGILSNIIISLAPITYIIIKFFQMIFITSTNSKESLKLNFEKKIDKTYHEGLALIALALTFIIPSSYFANYFPIIWIWLIGIDLFICAIFSLKSFQLSYTKVYSIGTSSFFSSSSMAFRVGRALLYLLIIMFISQDVQTMSLSISMTSFSFDFIAIPFTLHYPFVFVEYFNFFPIFLGLVVSGLILFGLITSYSVTNPDAYFSLFFAEHSDSIRLILIVVAIGLLGILARMYNIYGISTWDEGWYSDISYRMLQGEEWRYPLYFVDTGRNSSILLNTNDTIKLFDKPPLLFWLGAIGIQLFGYSSLAIKWPMNVFSGLMGLMGFLIYDHQRRFVRTDLISHRTEKESQIQEETKQLLGRDEEEEELSDAKIVGVIFGLTVSIAWFLSFYGRTSYLDPTIVAFSALTGVFGVKAIDHWFYGNRKRSYLYISLTAFMTMINLFSKAWQGLIIGIPIGIYLFGRYYEHFVPKQALLSFWRDAKSKFIGQTENPYSDILAFLSAIITIIGFSLISKVTTFTLPLGNFDLNVWGLLIGIFVYIGSRSLLDVYLKNNKDNNQIIFINLTIFTVLMFISGFIASIIGNFGFDLIFSRFNEAFEQIFVRYLTFVEENERVAFAENFTGILGGLTGGLLAWMINWFLAFVMLTGIDLVYYTIKKTFWFKETDYARKIIAEWSLLLPLSIFAGTIGFWIYYLLFKGEFFNRDPFYLGLAGITLSIIAYLVAGLIIELFSIIWKKILKKNPDDYYATRWQFQAKGFIIFLTFTSIVIILAFLPFMAWINWMDNYIVANDYIIRKAGELSNDPNPNVPADIDITYTWLFFEYYINWRYSSSGNYSLVDSLGGFTGPLFLATVPFCLTGLYAYHKKRDYSNAAFYAGWFILVLFTFVPATFQLNYYYLAAFFPYYGLVAYGIFWTLRKVNSAVHFRDNYEKMLLASPVLILLLISHVLPHVLNWDERIRNQKELYYFLLSTAILIGGFIILILFFVRSIPGIFATMFVIFNLNRYFVAQGIGNLDGEFLLINGLLIGICLFLIRDRFPLRSIFFLFIILMSAAAAMPWWVHYKVTSDRPAEDGYERIGHFIVEHGGDYNGSTWVFGETGSRYAIRYYMRGYNAINYQKYQLSSQDPFSSNSSIYMNIYIKNNPDLKFWVVLNRSIWDVKNQGHRPQSDWQNSYLWLKENFVWLNPLLNIPDTHHVHLFANSSVLTANEIIYLNNT
ncbi:MAG: ArnT family glycosyltransferase [Candidatus Hodarchaeales archaeon]|jgi:hypothetical protein